MSFFRFCWKNEKLDWPKCARTGFTTPFGWLVYLLWFWFYDSQVKTALLEVVKSKDDCLEETSKPNKGPLR